MLDSPDRTVVLVDSISKFEIGHYWQMSANFRRVFLESGINFVFLNPSALDAKQEDSLTSQQVKKSAYVTVPEGNRFFDKTLEYIHDFHTRNSGTELHIIFMWLPVVPVEHIEELLGISSTKPFFISGITFSKSFSTGSMGYHFEEEFSQNERCKKLWVWSDSFSTTPNLADSKIRKLPEFHPSFPKAESGHAEYLGFFGKLNSARGLSDVCIAALFNPKVSVVIKGYGYQGLRMWRSSSFSFLQYKTWTRNPFAAFLTLIVNIFFKLMLLLPNVNFDKLPFATQKELQTAIGNCTAVFYAAKLPYSSGIALTSLATGTPVIWFGSSGEAVKQLEKGFPEGRISRSQLFIPGYLSNRIKKVKDSKPKEMFSWKQFKQEVLDSL